jgi:hypothetical protein
VNKLALSAAILVLALPAFAQSQQPADPGPESPAKPKSTRSRFFFGGGIGAAFGTVDYVEIAPLIGFRAAPRVDLGVQPFYRWTSDTHYSTTDYGTRLFTRVRVISSFFAEADYEFTSYEYPNVYGGTSRASYNSFLAGGGYTVPLGHNAGMYFSVLYDFSYNGNAAYNAYDSPVQLQFGFSVGF